MERSLPTCGPQKRKRRHQLRHSNKPSQQKRGSGGVCLQIVQFRQFPQLGGNGPNKFILGKASAHTWSRKEGKVSVVRQKMLCRNNNRIRSVAVTVFAYRYHSSVSIPSSVGMDPSRLVIRLNNLPTRGANREIGASSSAANWACTRKVGM